MELYIGKLSECQKRENQLRQEREALIKKHEKALEELNSQISSIFCQRNQILEQFKQFLELNDASSNGSNENAKTSLEMRKKEELPAFIPSQPSQAFQKSRTILRANTDTASTVGEQYLSAFSSTPSPSLHLGVSNSEPSRRSPIPRQESENESRYRPGRAFKIVQRLKSSKSAGNLSLSVQSPTTNQIESMLNKVRTNEHSLDSNTMNQCIDLLSSRITKDRTGSIDLHLPTPTPTSVPDRIELIKPQALTIVSEIEVDPLVVESCSLLQSPKQPSSPKKPTETSEERKQRIERVLFGEAKTKKSGEKNLDSQHKSSTLSLTDVDYNNKSTIKDSSKSGESRYSNRRGKIKRNHSLSPLRFCLVENAKHEANIRKNEDSLRRYRSETFINSDAFSLDSFDVEEESISECISNVSESNKLKKSVTIDETNYKNMSSDENEAGIDDEVGEDNEKSEEDHLLAPSKVAKSQDLFQEVFFPTDLRQKPLMTKEELAKTRTNNVFAKLSTQMIHSKSDASDLRTESESPENCLSVDYLSHLRRNSASPETRLREKELNTLGNTQKFRCFKDFWETKTQEKINKINKYENWHQQAAEGPKPLQPTSSARKQQQPVQTKIQYLDSANQLNFNNQNKIQQSKTDSAIANKAKTTPEVIKANKQMESSFDQFKERELRWQTPQLKEPTAVAIQNKTNRVVPVLNNTNKILLNETNSKQMNTDNDKIVEKLRHFQQDIRQRRFKQQIQHFQQPVQTNNQPSMIPQALPANQNIYINQAKPVPTSKSLDLQYYPLSPNAISPKSGVIKIVYPNSPDIPTKNRIRLIRTYSRDESDEPEPIRHGQPAFKINASANNPRRDAINHQLIGKSKQPFTTMIDNHQAKRTEMITVPSSQTRSTYF